jgi:phosphopantothenoylcysteine decarboxylase/phosphopantothenate--cysteine ligase
MAEPAEILEAIAGLLGPAARPRTGRKVLITAGPTREPIDPVRYLANRSSGKQGYALARSAADLGAEVVLVSGPVDLAPPHDVRRVSVETATEMLAAVERELPADIAIFAAAVADWRVAAEAGQKLKKGAGVPPSLALTENPDILKTIARASKRPALVVGFAAETEDVVPNAQKKLRAKGCDVIIANDVGAHTGVMGGDRNRVHIVSASGVESWPEMAKGDVARKLMERFATHLAAPAKAAE